MKIRISVRALAISLMAMAAIVGMSAFPSALGGVANAQNGCTIMTHNVEIRTLDVLASQNRCFATNKARLIFQSDGNLVLYDENQHARFASGTLHRGHRLILQQDGNLVIYDVNARPLWDTHTAGNPGAFLAVQTDGNVVVYSRTGIPLWSTHTRH